TASESVLGTVGQRVTPEHVMNDRARLTQMSGLRSLAYAEPDPKLFPMSDFMRFFDHPMAQDASLMQYGFSQGDESLRVELVKLLAERDISATPQDILITSGVSQGISLLVGSLTRPGDVVAVEQPVYLGVLHVLNSYGVTPIGVPLDSEGLCLDVLEEVIQ